MTRRHIHYEAAFEDLLRSQGVPYIAVDEAKKAIFSGDKVKSFDFLIYSSTGTNWLVDVKGRKFPYETGSARRYWENWVTRADLEGLMQWEEVFGEGFAAMFVFAYWLVGSDGRWPMEFVHPYGGQYYAFLGVRAAEYRDNCRRRSSRWDTVAVAAPVFRKLSRPVQRLWT